MSDSSDGHLSPRQKGFVANWEDCDKAERNEVRNKLSDAITDLHFLCELPPTEAQEIVQDAVKEYRKSGHFDYDMGNLESLDEGGRLRQRITAKELLSAIISALYNGTDEEVFSDAVNHGIKQTVEWWETFDKEFANEFAQNLWSSTGTFENSLPTDGQSRSQSIISQYSGGKDLLREIIQDGGLVPSEKIVESGFEKGWHNSSIDELKDQRSDLRNSIREQIGKDIPYGSLEEAHRHLEVVIGSRKKARRIAHGLNHPKVASFNIQHFTQYQQRKYLDLHREPLDDQGILPDENDIPEYPDPTTQKPPDPTQLEFDQWENLKDIKEYYMKGQENDNSPNICILPQEPEFD